MDISSILNFKAQVQQLLSPYKAIGFTHGCFGFVNSTLNQVLSSRVRGAARKMLAAKRPLRQAKLFSSDMIWSLENALHSHLDGFWSYFCGFVLFGLY